MFGFPPIPDTELLKHWDFLIDESYKAVFCFDEVILGKALGNLRMGAGRQDNQPLIRELEFQCHPQTSGEEKGARD